MAEVLSDSVWERVSDSRVLVVGTGGIGCELLKNLVLTGFTDLALVTMGGVNGWGFTQWFLSTD